MKSIFHVLVLTFSLGLLICCNISQADPLGDIVKATGGMTINVNKGSENNPKAVAAIFQSRDIRINHVNVIPIQELKSESADHREFSFTLGTDDVDIDINVYSKNAQPISLYNPNKQLLSPPLLIKHDPINNNQIIKSSFSVYRSETVPGTWLLRTADDKDINVEITSYYGVNKVKLYNAYDILADKGGSIKFIVDPSMKDINVIISGKKDLPRVMLIGPNNQMAEGKSVTYGNTVMLQNLNNLAAGNWFLNFSATSPVDVQINALSHTYIFSVDVVRYRFGREGFDYFPYVGRLRPGSKEVFAVSLGRDDLHLQVDKIVMLDMSGRVIGIADPKQYYSDSTMRFGSLIIPAQSFQIMILGSDPSGHMFQRLEDTVFLTKCHYLLGFCV